MPTIVGILTFMSKKNTILGLSEPEKKLNFLIFIYLRAFKISCSNQQSMNFFLLMNAKMPTVVERGKIAF